MFTYSHITACLSAWINIQMIQALSVNSFLSSLSFLVCAVPLPQIKWCQRGSCRGDTLTPADLASFRHFPPVFYSRSRALNELLRALSPCAFSFGAAGLQQSKRWIIQIIFLWAVL